LGSGLVVPNNTAGDYVGGYQVCPSLQTLQCRPVLLLLLLLLLLLQLLLLGPDLSETGWSCI
jgi:hypothetical protein